MRTRLALVVLLGSILIAPVAGADPLVVIAQATDAFIYVDDDGEPAGLEYEILRFFANANDLELEVRWLDNFDELIPGVEGSQADLAAGSITATEERAQRVDFSAPYFPVRVMLVEPASSNTESLDDLRGATLATLRGTTYEELLQDVPEAHFVYANTEREMFEMIADGHAQAAACDSGVGLVLLETFDDLKLGLPLSEAQELAFPMPKGSDLKERLDAHINDLQSSSTYYRLLEKYLGAKAVEIVAAGRNE